MGRISLLVELGGHNIRSGDVGHEADFASTSDNRLLAPNCHFLEAFAPIDPQPWQINRPRTPCIDIGDGKEAVVFVDGNPGSGADWHDPASQISPFCRVLASDMPGFGNVDAVAAGLQPRDLAAWVIWGKHDVCLPSR